VLSSRFRLFLPWGVPLRPSDRHSPFGSFFGPVRAALLFSLCFFEAQDSLNCNFVEKAYYHGRFPPGSFFTFIVFALGLSPHHPALVLFTKKSLTAGFFWTLFKFPPPVGVSPLYTLCIYSLFLWTTGPLSLFRELFPMGWARGVADSFRVFSLMWFDRHFIGFFESFCERALAPPILSLRDVSEAPTRSKHFPNHLATPLIPPFPTS